MLRFNYYKTRNPQQPLEVENLSFTSEKPNKPPELKTIHHRYPLSM